MRIAPTAAALLLAALATRVPATAHDGHDHDASAEAAAAEPVLATRPYSSADIAALLQRHLARPPAASEVAITVRGDYRYITANGIPSHDVGTFPNRHNPNRITAQRYDYRVPTQPRVAERIQPTHGPFGVALNGVPFDPGTAEFWNRDRASGWNYEALSGKIDLGTDESNAHVQPTGAYHYHGMPNGLIAQLKGSTRAMTLVGYAADGFPIYALYGHSDPKDPASPVREMTASYRVKTGTRPSGPGGTYDGTFTADYDYVDGLGSLDACNGRYGVTPEYPGGIYHYYLTVDFPYIPRYLRGEPDRSFSRGSGGQGSGPNAQNAAGSGGRGPGAQDGPGGQGRSGGQDGPGGPGGPPPRGRGTTDGANRPPPPPRGDDMDGGGNTRPPPPPDGAPAPTAY